MLIAICSVFKDPSAQAGPRWEDGVVLYHLFAYVVKEKVVKEWPLMAAWRSS
jgi:hypothetical protein